MNYALNLADDGRILSVTFEEYAHENDVVISELPSGNISDYRYDQGAFVYDPLPAEGEIPTQMDRIEAQLAYTAMMTGTLLEA